MSAHRFRIGLLVTHPIRYYVPWYRRLAESADLEVFFSHRQTAAAQARAGFGVAFDWDVPLLDGYRSTFLRNEARRPSTDRFFGCRTPEITRIVREGVFDAFIVHGWSTWSYWQAMRACWATRTPLLVRGDSTLATPRSPWRRMAKELVYRWFIPRFDGYLIVGSRARDYVLRYGADPGRCFSAPHAVDNDAFSAAAGMPRDTRTALRQEFGLREDEVVFLFAGKFIHLKRPELFVNALARAASQGHRVSGLMAGDGPLRPKIQRLAADRNVHVVFPGFLNQTAMPRVYAAADAIVVPSDHETWGLVVNEAMASGVPAIASDHVGCVGDLVTHGVTGEVFRRGDEDALAECMARMAASADYRARLAREAAQRVAVFTVDAAVAGTLAAVEAVQAGRSNRAAWPAASIRRAER